MNITKAFASFHAKLANPHNQTMAISEDGAIVMSLWAQMFNVREHTVIDYTKRYALHKWTGAIVAEAFAARRPVRIVRPDYFGPLPEGSHQGLAKEFVPLTHLVGEIVEFDPSDEGRFVIKYRLAKEAA